jgi:hypothetical protein
VASLGWSIWYPNAYVKHIATSRSDHCPILLSMGHENNITPTQRISGYEIMYERDETLTEEISKS